MSIVPIPFDFNSGGYRHGLIPICLSLYDEHGHEIARPWFDAVARVAEYLRNLARKVLGDVWRVSELADLCVQAQWREHGDDFRKCPQRRTAEQLRSHIRDTGKGDLLAALDMILHGCRWDEIAGALGKDPTEQNVNTLRRRYVRTLRHRDSGRTTPISTPLRLSCSNKADLRLDAQQQSGRFRSRTNTPSETRAQRLSGRKASRPADRIE